MSSTICWTRWTALVGRGATAAWSRKTQLLRTGNSHLYCSQIGVPSPNTHLHCKPLEPLEPQGLQSGLETHPRLNTRGGISQRIWYPGRDSNPHGRKAPRILSPVRLPIPPPGQGVRRTLSLSKNIDDTRRARQAGPCLASGQRVLAHSHAQTGEESRGQESWGRTAARTGKTENIRC